MRFTKERVYEYCVKSNQNHLNFYRINYIMCQENRKGELLYGSLYYRV